MSQPVNALELRSLTLPAEPDLLAQCVKVNRQWLRSFLMQRSRSRRAAVRCLADPDLSEGLERAARVAVALSLGTASDRIQTQSILRTHGADSVELRSRLAEILGRVRHPAAAFLLLPMLREVPWLVRKTAFQSLLTLHHPITSESLLAAIWTDDGHLDSMLQVTQRLSQRECNRIFESLEQASVHEPRLASALQLIHSFVNARTFSSPSSPGAGCLIAAERLQRSIARDKEPNEFSEFLDSWFDWNDWQPNPAGNSLTRPLGEWRPASPGVAGHCSADTPPVPDSEPPAFSLTDVCQTDSLSTIANIRSWQDRLISQTRSQIGRKLTVATSLLLAIGIGVSGYKNSQQTPLQLQRMNGQPGVLRVSEKPEGEPATGLSAMSSAKPSEQRATEEVEAKIRITSSLRARE